MDVLSPRVLFHSVRFRKVGRAYPRAVGTRAIAFLKRVTAHKDKTPKIPRVGECESRAANDYLQSFTTVTTARGYARPTFRILYSLALLTRPGLALDGVWRFGCAGANGCV